MKQRCLARDFEPGSVIWVLNMVVAFFCEAWFSLRRATGVCKKTDNAVTFLNVSPMRLHLKNCKQLHEGADIWESDDKIWGDWQSVFFSDGEKKGTSNVGQKWVMVNLEYNVKMCHTHTIFSITVVLTIAPPNFKLTSLIPVVRKLPFDICQEFSTCLV